MEKGFVHMPLKRYDELILENKRMMEELENSVPMDVHLALTQAIERSFRIEGGYRDEPVLTFDYRNFLNIIDDLLAETKYAGKYKIKDVDSLYAERIYGVFERITEDDIDIKVPSDDGDRA
jgi:hypothetical protein